MKEIKRYLDNRIGKFSFYFEGLNDGYTYGFNENMKMPAAGCIKLPIAIALLKEIENNKFTLETTVKIEKADMEEGDSGIIHEFYEKDYAIIEILIAMLIQSDNTAANKIIDLIGKERINELIVEMGLKATELKTRTSDKRLQTEEQENHSTSYDLSKCFRLLNDESFLNKEHSAMLLKILTRQQERSKIPFFIPREVWPNVSNKAGSLENIENDSAILRIQKGKFLFTVMCKDVPSNVYGITTISRVSKMMWDIIDKNWK